MIFEKEIRFSMIHVNNELLKTHVAVGNIRGRAGGGDDDVCNTLERRWDGGHIVRVELDNCSAETRVEDGVVDGIVAVLEAESNVVTWVTGDVESWEGHDWESGVGAGARGNECRSDGVNHVEAKRGVVGGSPRIEAGDGG